jgi:putative membrane protein
VLRAVTSRVLASMKPSWRLSLEGLLPGLLIGVVQAVALTVVLQQLLDLSGGRALRLGGFALLTAVAFVALNHALVAWFGGVGRFVSVVLVVIGAAGAVTSAVPVAFDALRPLLPLTPALDGFRAIASGGTGAGAAAALLLAWLLLGLVAGVLAVARRRVLTPVVVPAAVA